MKLREFKLHSIYLETDRESFDLHNCFHFVGFDYDVSSRTLRLRWAPSAHAPPGQRRSIVVTFCQVTHFSAEPRDPETPFTEDDCLEGIYSTIPGAGSPAYLDAGTEPPSDSPYIFCFMSGFSLRVLGESAQYQLQ